MDSDVFAGRLLQGETIIWFGRPRQGIMFTGQDTFLIPFSILWGGFAIFWEANVLRGNSLFMMIWGVPFVVVGLFMMVGRFFLDAWLRARIFYALTDRRVLILRLGPWADFKAVSLDRLPEATISERPDGRGTIRFGERQSMWGGGRNNFGGWSAALDPAPQFLQIEDARRVFDLIQDRTQHNPR